MEKRRILLTVAILVIALCMAGVGWAAPMGAAFTYQGRLVDANSPAEGVYDFEFEVYDALDGGGQQGSTVSKDDLDVIDSYFTAELDFGSSVFTGDARWLQVAVRPGASSDPCDFATLNPRQELTPTPYAMHSENADTLDTFDSDAFAPSMHDHDGVYAFMAHSHDGVYALISHNHDDRYYTEEELETNGWSSVHWGNLLNIPATIADGDDDTHLSESEVDNYVSDNGYLDGGSALDWDNITIDMPIGFADGIDDVGGGDSDWTISGSDMYTGAGVTGNVGIGTTSPGTKFHVYEPSSSDVYLSVEASSSNAEAGVRLRNPAGGWDVFTNDDDADFAIAHAESDRVLTIEKTTGNVGIGTTEPNAVLDVDGSLILQNGSAINEFSKDGTLGDNSDDAVPTEKAVKTYVDSQIYSGSVGVVPVGGIVAWLKSFPNRPPLPVDFVECNGQTLPDADSPFNGQVIPNLNGGNRFLRGNSTSGTTGGSENHSHKVSSLTNPDSPGFNGLTAGQNADDINTTSSSSLPSYYEVVWIMRVK